MAAACPICGKHLTEPTFRPFCSKRCKLLDLEAWTSERYSIPVVEHDMEEEDEREEILPSEAEDELA